MAKRTTSRRLAMQALYQAEVSNIGVEEALKNIFEAEKFVPETIEFARQLAREAFAGREANDKIIEGLATDWPLDRIGKVDRAILRLALAELNFKETPTSVVIDEAVELAKKYTSSESSKFINGILGAYLRKSA